ncbi:MAG: FAD-dependent oxidoreductase, partial [Firmicutes bacterium]|nr:FAD-dependent oxidoreductase [Bacillota bacterium]
MLRAVVLGSRFGGLATLTWLRRTFPSQRLEITVVDQWTEMVYRPGLVHAGMANPRQLERYRFSLLPLWRRLGARGIHDTVFTVDPSRRRVVLASYPEIAYDVLFVATGVDPGWEEIAGLSPHRGGICEMHLARHTANWLQRWAGGTLLFAAGPLCLPQAGKTVPSVGCECPLLEVTLLTDAWLRRRGLRARTKLILATPAAAVGEEGGPKAQAYLARLLRQREVEVLTGAEFRRVAEDAVQIGERWVQADAMVWIPPYAGSALARRSGLADASGFIPVNGFGQHPDWPEVYAVGDIARTTGPKSGHAAMVQARVAVLHWASTVTHRPPPAPYRPLTLWAMELGQGQGLLVVSDVFWGGRREFFYAGRLPVALKRLFNQAYCR